MRIKYSYIISTPLYSKRTSRKEKKRKEDSKTPSQCARPNPSDKQVTGCLANKKTKSQLLKQAMERKKRARKILAYNLLSPLFIPPFQQ